MILPEGFLDRVKFARRRQALDGGDQATVGLDRQAGAGFHRYTVHLHHTGATLTGVASDLCPGKSQGISEEMDLQLTGFHVRFMGFAVHGYLNVQNSSLAWWLA